jgi:hypothetical protein
LAVKLSGQVYAGYLPGFFAEQTCFDKKFGKEAALVFTKIAW